MEEVLKIEKVVHRGFGLARVEGKVWLVPFSAPLDVIRARAKATRKGYIVGELVRIIEPSPYRVEPDCPYFGRCGGCHLQHIAERFQPSLKAQIVKEAFERVGLREVGDIEVASGGAWHYRHRVSLHCLDGVMGFCEMGSHKICKVSSCKICVPKINEEIQALCEVLKDVRRAEVEVSVDANGRMFVLIKSDSLDAKTIGKRLVATGVAQCAIIEHPSFGQTKVGDPEFCLKTWDKDGNEIEVLAIPTVFLQVNMGMNRRLVEVVLEMLFPFRGKTIFEGYCGAGNFTVGLVKGGAKVVAVDTDKKALRALDATLSRLSLDADLLIGDVARVALDFARNRKVFDAVLLDPPRQGARQALKSIVKFGAKRFVLVSCEISTLVRDIQFLSGFGYKVQRVVVLDMFPQTFHVETVALLDVL
jgi:23S rRNA (uracil1939-C5)-methyltransferase